MLAYKNVFLERKILAEVSWYFNEVWWIIGMSNFIKLLRTIDTTQNTFLFFWSEPDVAHSN